MYISQICQNQIEDKSLKNFALAKRIEKEIEKEEGLKKLKKAYVLLADYLKKVIIFIQIKMLLKLNIP